MSEAPDSLTDFERSILQDYPNLMAIMSGTVSGRSTDWPAMRPELRKLVRRVAGVVTKSEDDQTYGAIALTMLDRDERQEKKVICYPVTRIELLNVFNDRMPETVRAFRVDDGKWVEQQ